MPDKDTVLELLRNKTESSLCDFKREYYHIEKKADLIKDIVAFANNIEPFDKYIIFNIDNDSFEFGNMSSDLLPDVSEINSLLHEYCEPSISLELSHFSYQGNFIAYIRIDASNTNRPYVIKKDYTRNGKVLLNQGQIYIRRNTENYRANRHELDEIYSTREKYSIALNETPVVITDNLIINKNKERISRLNFSFLNDSKFNFLVNESEILFLSSTKSISVQGKYMADEPSNTPQIFEKIDAIPFSIPAYSIVKKSIYFAISEECAEHLKMRINNGECFKITLTLTDLSGKKVKTTPCLCKFVDL